MMYRSEDPRSRPIAQDAPTGAVTQALKRLTSIVEEAKALNAQLQGSMARTLNEAMGWFLRNHHGSLSLIGKDGATGSAVTYGEAEEFFKQHGEATWHASRRRGLEFV